jgi:hypothetical protein
MKSIPMIFNPDMALALHEDRKGQTRRPFTKRTVTLFEYAAQAGECSPFINAGQIHAYDESYVLQFAPVEPGDLIYVRETFYQYGRHVMPAWPEAEPEDAVFSGEKRVRFVGDELPENGHHFGESFWRKRPSIHMPRWASRTTLKVTGVRVERVQDISEDDAIAEGFKLPPVEGQGFAIGARTNFRHAWEQIYGEHWDNNGWCWVVDFEVIKANVDVVIEKMGVA